MKIKGIIIISTVTVALLWVIFSGLYIVQSNSMAVITRFGKVVGTADSGLNFKLPFGIDRARSIPVKTVMTEEFGYKSNGNYSGEYQRGANELKASTMLSADLKVINVEWIVQYKISDPVKYLFKVDAPEQTLHDLAIGAMSQVCGDYLFDEIITIAKSDITFKVSQLIQKMSDELELGFAINTVQLMNVTPPQAVETAYNEVLQSQQEKDKSVNEAKTESNKKVIPVEGEAERVIAQARGYYSQRVKLAEGEAKYFNALYSEYIKAPEVTKKRMYLETWSQILSNLENVQVIDEKQRNLVPFLPLNQTVKGAK